MKTLYLDLSSGISGDMFVGAMLDLGVELAELEKGLAGLQLEGYHLHAWRGQKAGIAGIKFEVCVTGAHGGHPATAPLPHHHDHGHEHGHDHAVDLLNHGLHNHVHHVHPPEAGHGPAHAQEHAEHGGRDFGSIQRLINSSSLSPWAKGKSLAVFRRLAVAEGKVHGLPPEQVHFHEVGAVDSIVDIVGACVALERLGQPRVLASAVVEGTGWLECAHGRYPLPAPATLEVLAARGVTVQQCAEPHELVTPTGAALLAEFVADFGPLPGLKLTRVGYGLGSRDHPTRPNVLRAVLAEGEDAAARPAHDWETDTVAVLETNLDDVNPEILGHFVEQTLAAGALDVFHTPIQMKKSRPGVLLTVLCQEADADRFTERLLRETSAFGVRRTVAQRRKLRREFRQVHTPYGAIQVKLGLLDGRAVQVAPEFESCREAALRAGAPLKDVYEAAAQTAAQRQP